MKEKEAPEKIYTLPSCHSRWYEEKRDDENIEYVRKDAFIKRAKKWFEQQPETYDANGVRVYGEEDFEDFRKAMKGE